MMRTRGYPALLLVLMGFMDCLTTVIGMLYFGAVELNPLIVGMVSTNLSAFVILKLITTVSICLLFMQTEKILMKTSNKTIKAFNYTSKLLKVGYIGIIAFLVIVVANNLAVIASTI